MSQDNFKYSVYSNNHDGDDFFMPSDLVWHNIKAELDEDKRDRKPFIFFLFSGAGILLIASFLLFGSQRFSTKSNYSQLNQSKQAIIEENQNKLSVKEAVAQKSEGEESMSEQLELEQNKNNPTSQNKESINQELSPDKTALSRDVSLTGLESSNTSFATQQSNIVSKQKDGSLISLSQTSQDNSRVKTISGEQNDLALNDQNTKTLSEQIARNSAQLNASSEDQQLRPEVNQSIELIDISLLALLMNALIIDADIDQKHWREKMNLVDIAKTSSRKRWSAEVFMYSSVSSYLIQDFSGFNSVDFDLAGDQSNGGQFLIKRQLTERLSLAVGIGFDNSHFSADYGIGITQDELSVSDAGTKFQSTLNKNLPSLAGGLATSFNLVATTSNLKTSTIRLNLAHNYRTITAPLFVEYSLVQSNRFQLNVGTGLIFSKRLLAIDTGVNLLNGNSIDEPVELASIAAIDLDDQPFRIYNVSNSLSIGVDYLLSNSFSVGLRSSVARPLFNIYEDQNYTVRSRQYQLGLNVSYTFKGG